MKYNIRKQWVISCIDVLMIYFTICIFRNYSLICKVSTENCSKIELLDSIIPFSPVEWLSFIIIIFFAYKGKKTVIKSNKICAMIFSCLTISGVCYENVGALFEKMQFGLFDIILIITYMGTYIAYCYAFHMIESILQKFMKCEVCVFFKDKHLFRNICIILGILWIPYIIIRYPAGIESDAYHQLLQFCGLESLNAHFPLLSTLIIGGTVTIGKYVFGTYEMGVFFFVICQSIICIMVFAYSLVIMYKLKCNRVWILASLIMYAIVPLYPGFSSSITKDTLFSIAVLVEIILLSEYLLLESERMFIKILISSSAVCLLRNNGIYIILFLLIIGCTYFLITKQRRIKRILFPLLGACLVFMLYDKVLIRELNLDINTRLTHEQDSIKEMMSIPFQQTARYLRDYPNDISTEEKNIIGNVLDVENIAQEYNPLLSDMVKGTYHGSNDDIKRYFVIWTKMFFRHPAVYLDATMHNCYGFFYPGAVMRNKGSLGMYFGTNSDSSLEIKTPISLKKFVAGLKYYIHMWEKIPIFCFFYHTGFQMWIAIWLLVTVVHRKVFEFSFLMIPTAVGILVCIASPTWWHNGFRYALPIMFANPFLVGVIMNKELPYAIPKIQEKTNCEVADK